MFELLDQVPTRPFSFVTVTLNVCEFLPLILCTLCWFFHHSWWCCLSLETVGRKFSQTDSSEAGKWRWRKVHTKWGEWSGSRPSYAPKTARDTGLDWLEEDICISICGRKAESGKVRLQYKQLWNAHPGSLPWPEVALKADPGSYKQEQLLQTQKSWEFP